MNLYSTNNSNNIVELREAVLNAFPMDRGLYMPCNLNEMENTILESLPNLSFQEIALAVCKHLFREYIPENNLIDIVNNAVNFPAPVVKLSDDIYSLELFHGPSLAFKDFGARFMAQLMSYFLKDETQETTILVATSGDTGGAVAAGFHNVPGINVIILYPQGKVSELQKLQLTTWGNNISAVEVDGVFDDCQAMVKEAFLDEDLKSRYNFSSANSINIARLIPQSFYYFEAAKQFKGRDIVFAVPSGNFGNLTAGLIAKKLGLKIDKFIAATNINRTVPHYLETGEYRPKASFPTLSNAMDVGAPSNFVRIMALYGSTWNMVKKDILPYWLDDDQTIETMHQCFYHNNYILDPHGAIAYKACKEYQSINNSDRKYIFLETAHPAKFKDTVEKSIKREIELPTGLARLQLLKSDHMSSGNSFYEFKNLLMSL